MTVTIITDNVIAHRRAGEISQSAAGARTLTPQHYVRTAPSKTSIRL